MVRTVRLCPLRRRRGPDVGNSWRAVAGALARRWGKAKGVVLRSAVPCHRRHQVNRGEIPGPRRFYDPLGRRVAARRVQRTIALVCPRRDAGVQSELTATSSSRRPDDEIRTVLRAPAAAALERGKRAAPLSAGARPDRISRPAWHRLRLGSRAPLPRGVFALLGPRGVSRRLLAAHQTYPSRSWH